MARRTGFGILLMLFAIAGVWLLTTGKRQTSQDSPISEAAEDRSTAESGDSSPATSAGGAPLGDALESPSHHGPNSGTVTVNAQTEGRRAPTTLLHGIFALCLVAFLLIPTVALDNVIRAKLAWLNNPDPRSDTAYDLFLATLGTVMSALIALYFTVAASVTLAFKENPDQKVMFDNFFQTQRVVPPVILVVLTFVLLGLRTYQPHPLVVAPLLILILAIWSLDSFGRLANLLRAAIPTKPNI